MPHLMIHVVRDTVRIGLHVLPELPYLCDDEIVRFAGVRRVPGEDMAFVVYTDCMVDDGVGHDRIAGWMKQVVGDARPILTLESASGKKDDHEHNDREFMHLPLVLLWG